MLSHPNQKFAMFSRLFSVPLCLLSVCKCLVQVFYFIFKSIYVLYFTLFYFAIENYVCLPLFPLIMFVYM